MTGTLRRLMHGLNVGDKSAVLELEDELYKVSRKEGGPTDCYNYLLLDPFVIVNNRNAVINLPTFHKNYREAVALMAKKRDTETCVKSTFYVGKGKGDRCFFHLKAATYYYHNSVPLPGKF
ncbi:hypothetical protein AAVH_06523 [Aphelenchoides avenae]|nr:hypothetical protein AAVH_06523 [Aphelenchus avenae]